MSTATRPALQRSWADIEAGQVFEPIHYRISREAVDAFIAATGADHPWYTEGSPYGGPIVPPTLPCTDYTLFLSQILPPIVGMHANHRLRLVRPILVGAQVRVSCQVIDKFRKRQHKYLVMEYTIDDGEGNVYMANTITMTVDAYIRPTGVERETADD